jgi:Tfp pilus assembly protein PilF
LDHDRGIALLRLGDRAAASKSFQNSLKNDPRNVEALCLLGEIALAQGDRSAAQSYLGRAMAIDQTYDSARELSIHINAEKHLPRPLSPATR